MSSKVYFIQATRKDGPELISRKVDKVFQHCELEKRIEKRFFVAIKTHFGEVGNTGFIKPQWISRIVNRIKRKTSKVFLTDTNTLYVGSRSNSVDHLNLALSHGFSPESLGIPVIIADGLLGHEGEELKVNLSRIKKAKIASAFIHSDFLLCLSHFTGHIATGFGGAVKNLGMGCASRAGKLEQHSDIHPWVDTRKCINCGICLDYCSVQAIFQENGTAVIDIKKCIGCGECLVVCKENAVKMRWDADSVRVQEKMSEYALSLKNHLENRMGCLNFLLQVTKDCDCLAKDQPAIVEDMGILASSDPVAIDKASADMVCRRAGRDIFRDGYDIDWSVQLTHGEKIGLGRMDYDLIEIT